MEVPNLQTYNGGLRCIMVSGKQSRMIRTSPTISDSTGTVFLLCLVMSASAGLGSSDLQDDCIALFGKPCIGTKEKNDRFNKRMDELKKNHSVKVHFKLM